MSTDLARRTFMQSGAALAATLIVGAPALAQTAPPTGDIDKAEQAAKAGFVCLQKPFRLSDSAAAVSKLLAGKAGGGEFSNPPRLTGRQLDPAR